MSENVDRPIFITILGVLIGIVGIAVLVIGICGAVMPDVLSDLAEEMAKDITDLTVDQIKDMLAGFCYAAIVIGAVILVVAIGFFKGWALIWYLALLVFIISLIGGIYGLVVAFQWGSVVGLAITIVILVYLFSPKVRGYFGI